MLATYSRFATAPLVSMMSLRLENAQTSLRGNALLLRKTIDRTPRHLQEAIKKSKDIRCCVVMEVGKSDEEDVRLVVLANRQEEPPSPVPRAAIAVKPRSKLVQPVTTPKSVINFSLPWFSTPSFRVLDSDVILDPKRSLLKKACLPGRLIAALQFQSRLGHGFIQFGCLPSGFLFLYRSLLKPACQLASLPDVTNNLKSRQETAPRVRRNATIVAQLVWLLSLKTSRLAL